MEEERQIEEKEGGRGEGKWNLERGKAESGSQKGRANKERERENGKEMTGKGKRKSR